MSNHSIKFRVDLISSFFSNPVNRQTDRQTDAGKTITSLVILNTVHRLTCVTPTVRLVFTINHFSR